jgi:hypothetical protein
MADCSLAIKRKLGNRRRFTGLSSHNLGFMQAATKTMPEV